MHQSSLCKPLTPPHSNHSNSFSCLGITFFSLDNASLSPNVSNSRQSTDFLLQQTRMNPLNPFPKFQEGNTFLVPLHNFFIILISTLILLFISSFLILALLSLHLSLHLLPSKTLPSKFITISFLTVIKLSSLIVKAKN